MMNTKDIKAIMDLFEASDIAKLEVESDGVRILMEKPTVQGMVQPVTPIAAAIPPISESTPVTVKNEKEESGYWVKAPIVGTYYQSRTPGGAPFVEIGQHVKKGDVLCIIEAMKVMNEIHSPIDGTVQDILLTQESMVEYDQQLIRIGADA